MYIILIRRFVRSDRRQQFLDKYRGQISHDPAFLGETLTELSKDEDLPAGLMGLLETVPGCINYVNVAKWADWRPFVGQCDLTANDFDPEIEIAPRQRMVLRIVDEVSAPDDVDASQSQ